jgi:hypothetical protein
MLEIPLPWGFHPRLGKACPSRAGAADGTRREMCGRGGWARAPGSMPLPLAGQSADQARCMEEGEWQSREPGPPNLPGAPEGRPPRPSCYGRRRCRADRLAPCRPQLVLSKAPQQSPGPRCLVLQAWAVSPIARTGTVWIERIAHRIDLWQRRPRFRVPRSGIVLAVLIVAALLVLLVRGFGVPGVAGKSVPVLRALLPFSRWYTISMNLAMRWSVALDGSATGVLALEQLPKTVNH